MGATSAVNIPISKAPGPGALMTQAQLDAIYQYMLARLAREWLKINRLSVFGDVDCNREVPRMPFQLGTASHLFSGVGVPAATLGVNGDYYFRKDGIAANHIYFKAAGAWGAIT